MGGTSLGKHLLVPRYLAFSYIPYFLFFAFVDFWFMPIRAASTLCIKNPNDKQRNQCWFISGLICIADMPCFGEIFTVLMNAIYMTT